MTTLKELKKAFPKHISTSGCIYYIDGFGWYKQKNTYFGLETSVRDFDGNWSRINFNKLVEDVKNMFKEDK